MNDVSFAYPFVLYFLLIIPLILFWYWKKNKKIVPDLTYSSLGVFKDAKPALKERLRHLPVILRTAALLL